MAKHFLMSAEAAWQNIWGMLRDMAEHLGHNKRHGRTLGHEKIHGKTFGTEKRHGRTFGHEKRHD